MTTKAVKKGKTRVVYKDRPRPDAYDQSWHLDKKVPIALIVAMIGQVALGASWATTMDNSLKALKEDFASIKGEIKNDKDKLDGLIELRGELRSLITSVGRLERWVERQEYGSERKAK